MKRDKEEDEKERVFDYKAMQQRISPHRQLDNKSLIKCMDINLVHKMIKEKKDQIESLHNEVGNLQNDYKEQFKNREDVILRLTRDNDDQGKKMIDLENKIQTLEKRNEKTTNETIKNFNGQIGKLDKEAKQQVNDTTIKMTEMTENLDKMQPISKEKLKYELEFMAWQQDCTSLEKTIQEEKYNIEIEQARMKREMEAQFQESLEQFKAQAKQDAQRNIQEIERNIHYENQKLTEKTMGQRYNLEYYKREKQKLDGNQKNQNRDITIQQETADQYEARGLQQQKKIKVLKEKILVLEKSLQQIVYDFEKEKELLKFQHEQIIKDQREDIQNLRESLRQRNKELKNVRALSQVMLNQRSEIEQFFLEALEQIKEEIRKKIAIERKQKKNQFGGLHQSKLGSSTQGGPTQGSLGQSMMTGAGEQSKIGANSQLPDSNKPYSEKVDLNDLDWEDRERVLRLLFSKMNAGAPANAMRVQQQQKMMSDNGGSAGNMGEYSALPAINYDGHY